MKYIVWIMRCIGAVVLVMVASCVGWIGWNEMGHPDIVYAYRLTVEAEMAGRTYTGSSVTEVRWEHRSKLSCFPDTCPEWSVASIRAEALVVNMGENGLLLTSLGNLRTDVASLPEKAYHDSGPGFVAKEADLKRLVSKTGVRAVKLEWLPTAYFLPNPDNLTDVACADLPKPFQVQGGLAPVVTRTTLQMVQEPPNAEAERALPWLKGPEPELQSRLETINEALWEKYKNRYCELAIKELKRGM